RKPPRVIGTTSTVVTTAAFGWACNMLTPFAKPGPASRFPAMGPTASLPRALTTCSGPASGTTYPNDNQLQRKKGTQAGALFAAPSLTYTRCEARHAKTHRRSTSRNSDCFGSAAESRLLHRGAGPSFRQ